MKKRKKNSDSQSLSIVIDCSQNGCL